MLGEKALEALGTRQAHLRSPFLLSAAGRGLGARRLHMGRALDPEERVGRRPGDWLPSFGTDRCAALRGGLDRLDDGVGLAGCRALVQTASP